MHTLLTGLHRGRFSGPTPCLTNVQADTHTHAHTSTHTYTHAHTHTHAQSQTQTHTHVGITHIVVIENLKNCLQERLLLAVKRYHTHTHTCAHTHIHTHGPDTHNKKPNLNHAYTQKQRPRVNTQTWPSTHTQTNKHTHTSTNTHTCQPQLQTAVQ